MKRKKTKNKKGIKNYPIPNYQGRLKFFNPIKNMIAKQPKSYLTLEEYMQTDEYQESENLRKTLSKQDYWNYIKNRGKSKYDL